MVLSGRAKEHFDVDLMLIDITGKKLFHCPVSRIAATARIESVNKRGRNSKLGDYRMIVFFDFHDISLFSMPVRRQLLNV